MFEGKNDRVNYYPINTISSRHSVVGDFQSYSQTDRNPFKIQKTEKVEKLLNKFNDRDDEMLYHKCKSLEDVVEGLLAMEKKFLSSDAILSDNKYNLEYGRSKILSDSGQLSDTTRHGFSSESFFKNPKEFFNASYNDSVFIDSRTCANCRLKTSINEAQNFYLMCNYCETWYCSRQCRGENWHIHKALCMFGRIASTCKRVIKFCNSNPETQLFLSQIARRGFIDKGRGCVNIKFNAVWSAENFCMFGLSHLQEHPTFISKENFFTLPELSTATENYNPDIKYILIVSICIKTGLSETTVEPGIRCVQKSAQLRLSLICKYLKPETEMSSILILKISPGNLQSSQSEDRKVRETSFINIQQTLSERGVNLRHHYPKLYRKLIDFVAEGKHFPPSIFSTVGKGISEQTTYVVMVEYEPDIEWILDPYHFNHLEIKTTLTRDNSKKCSKGVHFSL